MGGEDVGDDGESQARTAGALAGAGVVEPREALEDGFALPRGDARTVVVDGEHGVVVVSSQRDLHALRGVGRGVVDPGCARPARAAVRRV